VIFSYKCNCQDGSEEIEFPIGKAPAFLQQCKECGALVSRDYHSDFATVNIAAIDPYRKYHLSSRKMHEEARQQRTIGGPQDNIERKRLERENGITYVGDDTSGFSKKARRGIERQLDKKRAGEVV